uniref:Uncharacterized protein LOC114335445 n=1 Tax=Diabrotica virgifera virgifera TaxID=50390 RepID=A0A6P7FY31_DIAVI
MNPFLNLGMFEQIMFQHAAAQIQQAVEQGFNAHFTATDDDDSTIDFEPMVPQKKDYEPKMTDLELLEKTVSMMKSDKDFLLILQNILKVCDDPEKFKPENLAVLRGFAQLLDEIRDDNCEKPLKFISATLSGKLTLLSSP